MTTAGAVQSVSVSFDNAVGGLSESETMKRPESLGSLASPIYS